MRRADRLFQIIQILRWSSSPIAAAELEHDAERRFFGPHPEAVQQLAWPAAPFVDLPKTLGYAARRFLTRRVASSGTRRRWHGSVATSRCTRKPWHGGRPGWRAFEQSGGGSVTPTVATSDP
jgi:hypothetical protein